MAFLKFNVVFAYPPKLLFKPKLGLVMFKLIP